jgi:hypothetical protein
MEGGLTILILGAFADIVFAQKMARMDRMEMMVMRERRRV